MCQLRALSKNIQRGPPLWKRGGGRGDYAVVGTTVGFNEPVIGALLKTRCG